MKSEIVLFRKVVLVAIVVGVAVAALGCPSEQYFSDQRGNGGATSTAATTGGTGGSAPCSAMTPCKDDKNSCTMDACVNGFCVYTSLNLAEGPESTECSTVACVDGVSAPPQFNKDAPCGVGLKCNAAGQCVGCKDVSACPAPSGCQNVSCENAMCKIVPAPEGDPSDVMNAANDCKKPVCDGKGGVEFAYDDTDLPIDDGNPCTDQKCINGTSMYPPSSNKTACASMANPNAKFCDGAGACVECAVDAQCTVGMVASCDISTHTCISCSDMEQNGTEIGIDCGGVCPKCANGTPCANSAGCSSGYCVDGFCCDTACAGICAACNNLMKAGVCSQLPAGHDDANPLCSGASTCDAGACVSDGGKQHFGEGCVKTIDCYQGACTGQPLTCH